jgi:DNA-binding CsgD family transcriptional regulator
MRGAASATAVRAAFFAEVGILSKREFEVAALVKQGLSPIAFYA